MKVPFIPDSAPFNEDQKAWISGFLAGLHSRAAMNLAQMPVVGVEQTQQAIPLHILYGTQTGNAEAVANDAADLSRKNGFVPSILSLDDVTLEALSSMVAVIVVVSTYGEGEMPDNAQLFWEALSGSTAPRLESLNYAVLGLGDTSYDEFCQAGKLIDTRFEQLGARRVHDRVDCDIDFEDIANEWLGTTLPKMQDETAQSAVPSDNVLNTPRVGSTPAAKSEWTRKNPYNSSVVENRLLSNTASAKEIRHLAFELAETGMAYAAGDALGVIPQNDPALVELFIDRLGLQKDVLVSKFDLPLAKVLLEKLEIATPPKALVHAVAERANDDELSSVLANGDKEALDAFLWGKDTLDLLNINARMTFSVDELVALLKPLQHRAYSISSSPKAHVGEVHLTVAAVRWVNAAREHKGVCSTYLADQITAGDQVPIFISPNKAFRLPEDHDAPIIMVGPGTGVAPFRAFLEERREIGAQGRNWLFFGDQHRAHDFIYEDEISAMSSDSLITRLDLAFSRDQSAKVYVQSRMRENGKELFSWLEDGGYFYVCGDATRMARDVDDTLHEIIEEHGGLNKDAANEYVGELKRSKRYRRDVY